MILDENTDSVVVMRVGENGLFEGQEKYFRGERYSFSKKVILGVKRRVIRGELNNNSLYFISSI